MNPKYRYFKYEYGNGVEYYRTTNKRLSLLCTNYDWKSGDKWRRSKYQIKRVFKPIKSNINYIELTEEELMLELL